MCKKVLTVLLAGVLLLVSSCVDKRYDLVNKEITTDVKLEGNTIALPIGDLKPILLDSLVDVDEIDFLKESNGVFSICMDSTISIKESVDPVTFDIDPITHSADIKFNNIEISKVHLEAANMKAADFKTPTISLDGLNGKLPTLESEVSKAVVTAEVLEFLKRLEIPELKQIIPIEQVGVDCRFNYNLPKEIEYIDFIKFGSSNDVNGSLIEVEIINPEVLSKCSKEISFDIEFPEIFELSKNPNAEQAGKYRVEGNRVKVEGLLSEGQRTVISFYINKLSGLSNCIENGVLSVDEKIVYNISYKVEGEVDLNDDTKVSDFDFKVRLNSKLSFLDAAGKIADIKVDFKPIKMEFAADFDNLEHIDTIRYVEFVEEESYIKFDAKILDKGWLNTFNLKEGYALRIKFPEELDIADELSYYKGKENGDIKYEPTEHAFYIKNLSLLAENHWDIALRKLTLNKAVTKDPVTGKNVCHLDVEADIEFVGADNNVVEYLLLDGVYLESVVDVLNALDGSKEIDFTMSESDITVKDAVVDTDVIHSSLETKTSFDFEGEVPAEIGKIEKIGFDKDVEITIDFSVNGLGNLDTDININAGIVLPPFLKLVTAEQNSDVVISEGVLEIKNLSYNPAKNESRSIRLLCTGLDFTMLQDGGLSPVDSKISYSSDIVVNGDVTVEEEELHSEILGKAIDFDIVLKMEPITVKMFHGLYSGEIKAIEENIEFDLGEDLEFLRESGNSIKLADPQLEFVLTNTVGVPIDVDLQILATNENGEAINEPVVGQMRILPAELDAEADVLKRVQTKLFFTTDAQNNNRGDGYTVIEIPELANLLEEIPYNINFKIEPKIVGNSHHVNILEPIALDGEYSVIIPLKFEDLNISYTDTIKGLKGDLGETLKQFTNSAIRLKMNVANTIPLGLSLSVVPMDENGNVLEGLETGNIVVKAGNGGGIMDPDNVPEYSYVELSIGSKGGDLSELDKLLFTVNATANSTAGGIGLKAEQGLKILDVVFEVSGDIEFK